jgi:sporulation protein YlmC with PRC-barrel domain
MRKVVLAMAFISAFVFGFIMVSSMAREMMEKSGKTSDLLGKAVKNLKGENLGTITDVVSGPEGRGAFVILTYWMSDDTQRRIAVPFSVLSCQKQKCVLNASRDKLVSEPAYGSEDELSEPKVAEDIYRYFGVQPYWTGEGTKK